MENQISHFSTEREFSYTKEPYVPSHRRESQPPGPIRASSSQMHEDLLDIRRGLNINGARLQRLEAREIEKIPAPTVDRKSVEDTDNVWVDSLLALGGQGPEGSNISAVRTKIEQRVIDESLPADEAKRRCQVNSKDDAWVKEMLALGGQTED